MTGSVPGFGQIMKVTSGITPMSPDEQYEGLVQRHLDNLRAGKEARRRFHTEAFVPFTFHDDLEEELQTPDPDVQWTIEGLHTVGGNTTITAGFKVGKSTLMVNLIRSLVDGEPFLGTHGVRKLDGRVLYLNYEVVETQMRQAFREVALLNPKRLTHWPLRGRRLDFNDEAAREWFVSELKRLEIEVLILDPFSGAYHGEENSNSEVGGFTKLLDQIKELAGVLDLFMPAHTGRDQEAERARGATKLDDWADSRWVLTRTKEDPTGSRFMWAEGRRVDYGSERELQYDRPTQRLSYSAFAGTRRTKTMQPVRLAILNYVAAHPGCTSRNIRENVTGNTKAIENVLKELISEGKLETVDGPKRAIQHYLANTGPSHVPAI